MRPAGSVHDLLARAALRDLQGLPADSRVRAHLPGVLCSAMPAQRLLHEAEDARMARPIVPSLRLHGALRSPVSVQAGVQ